MATCDAYVVETFETNVCLNDNVRSQGINIDYVINADNVIMQL